MQPILLIGRLWNYINWQNSSGVTLLECEIEKVCASFAATQLFDWPESANLAVNFLVIIKSKIEHLENAFACWLRAYMCTKPAQLNTWHSRKEKKTIFVSRKKHQIMPYEA